VIVLLVAVAIGFDSGLSTMTSFRPDLLLLVVIAAGFAAGPLSGAVTGFGAGLLLDLAPYSANLVGTSALAFTVIGYSAGVLTSAWCRTGSTRVVGGGCGRPANRLLRFLRPIAFSAGAIAVVGLVLGCFTVLFDRARFGWTGVTELCWNSAVPTILLAPVIVPALVALLRRRR
jgi:cell shape-determining protein MreD